MQITSSQSTSSTPSISRVPSPSPTLPTSQETASHSEENQLSNQPINGFVVDAGQTSNQSDIGSTTRVGRDPRVDTISISQQLEKIKDRIPSRLNAITTNLSRISGRLDQLEPKFLTIALPVCVASLSFWLYATNTFLTFQGKPNHQSEPLLDDLLKQVNQFGQANDSMPNRLDLLEAELGRLSTLLNQSNSQSSHPAFSACAFSIFLCFCVMSTLWKKLNSQSIQNKELEQQLSQLKNEKTDLALEFSSQSALSKDQISKLQELEQQLSQLKNEKTNLVIELSSQSEHIQTLRNQFDAFTLNGYGIADAATAQDVQRQFSELQLDWQKIAKTPSTTSGYGITDAAPLDSPAFVGTPTAPTPNEARNYSTQVATTAFTQNAIQAAFTGPDRQSFETLGGYQKLPGGLIFQWGFTPINSDGMFKVTFPIKFPTKFMIIQGTYIGDENANVIEYSGTRTSVGVTLHAFGAPSLTSKGRCIQWFAYGD